jgi:hypothetical protein
MKGCLPPENMLFRPGKTGEEACHPERAGADIQLAKSRWRGGGAPIEGALFPGPGERCRNHRGFDLLI